MPIMKIIISLNWILISLWGAVLVYAFVNQNDHSDAAGRGQESALIGLGVILLLLIVGLNLLPYTWTKITALLIASLLLYWVYYMQTH